MNSRDTYPNSKESVLFLFSPSVANCTQRLGIEPFDAQEVSHLGKESGRLGMNPNYWRKDAKDGTGTCNQAQGAGGGAVDSKSHWGQILIPRV